MTASDDLLTRVAAANPVATTDDATPDQKREAELLLDRVLASLTQEPPPRRATHRGLVAVGVAASLVAVLMLVLVLSPSERGLAERAYAAMTAPEFFHVVVRTTSDRPDLNAPPGERREVETTEQEAWYDTRSVDFHWISRTIRGDGSSRVEMEAAGTRDGTVVRLDGQTGGVTRIDEDGSTSKSIPERFDPTADTKAFLRDPDAREAGEVTIDNRRARRLVIDRPDWRAEGPTPAIVEQTGVVLIDAQTLYPIEWREQAFYVRDGIRERASIVVRYTSFETLPRTTENLRLLKIGARP